MIHYNLLKEGEKKACERPNTNRDDETRFRGPITATPVISVPDWAGLHAVLAHCGGEGC
jgi:hypothetical protein